MPIWPQPHRATPTLNAGRLRHRVDIVRVATPQDASGGFDLNADTVYANVWASVESLTAAEKFAAHEFVSQVTHQVVIRWIGAAPSWQPEFMYLPGALVVDSNGNLQQAQDPGGQSSATVPAWQIVVGSLSPDGASLPFDWKNLGIAPRRTGVNAGMQVWFQGRQFQIEGVLNPDERNKLLILMCIEINDSLQQLTNQPAGLN